MIGFLRHWWNQRRRRIDIDILWPVCFEEAAGDIDRARGAFLDHALRDPAWLELERDHILAVVGSLLGPK